MAMLASRELSTKLEVKLMLRVNRNIDVRPSKSSFCVVDKNGMRVSKEDHNTTELKRHISTGVVNIMHSASTAQFNKGVRSNMAGGSEPK